MLIAYENEGKIITQSFTDSATVVAFPHVVIDREILEPIESWYIEDGEIKIDQQKLIEYNRKNMPDLSRIEFKYKLHKAEKLEEIEQFIKTTDNFLLQLAYNEAQFFSRTDPFIDQARIALGLTDEQVDMIWESSLV